MSKEPQQTGAAKITAENMPADWEAIHNRSGQDVLFTKFAYKQYKKSNEIEMKALAEAVPENYQLLVMTDYLDDTKKHSYSCAVFVNHETKDIVFANAGSRFGAHKAGISDARDDIRLIMKKNPHKVSQAAELNRIILDSLGAEAKDFKFHYTGHSLGGALADIAAADMDIELRKRNLKQQDLPEQITAITFENPGAKPMIDMMYKGAGLSFENKKDGKFYSFSNRANVINSLNPQVGESYRIVPDNQTELSSNPVRLLFATIANYCSKMGSKVISTVCNFLSMGGKQLKMDHKLTHFENVFIKKEGKVVALQAVINSPSAKKEQSVNVIPKKEKPVVGKFTDKVNKETGKDIKIGLHRTRH